MRGYKLLGSIIFVLLLTIQLSTVLAQPPSYIYGTVTDTSGKALPYVNIVVGDQNKGTASNDSGRYILNLPAGTHTVNVSLIGYAPEKIIVHLQSSQTKEINITLKVDVKNLREVTVVDRSQDISRIQIKEFGNLPNPSASLEAVIKTMPGVSSSNELSSQYSVRGGNFDENLVYVNDVEIIRPFLIRSGQQEGLSFINPDLVNSIRFSAGGFESRYGDKMSSVLDVSYRTPQKAALGIHWGLLGGSVSVEGVSKDKKMSVISGFRYKTTRLLLGSLDSKGEYEPDFIDWQMLFNYKLNEKLSFSVLTNYASNSYTFVPQTRNTNFGTYANVYNLKIYYSGREDDKYNSLMGALTTAYQIKPNLQMKLIANT
ncbi:MAG TPA: TonB-dependent receptor, partial [Bacteroidales bacterium]|nr:TonB-dependent receptor [Bacteroidales bacterium]